MTALLVPATCIRVKGENLKGEKGSVEFLVHTKASAVSSNSSTVVLEGTKNGQLIVFLAYGFKPGGSHLTHLKRPASPTALEVFTHSCPELLESTLGK